MKTEITVQISLKTGIADPPGGLTQQALHNMGYGNVANVRIGKTISFVADCTLDEVDEMCKKLLVNSVTEDYHIIRVEPSETE